ESFHQTTRRDSGEMVDSFSLPFSSCSHWILISGVSLVNGGSSSTTDWRPVRVFCALQEAHDPLSQLLTCRELPCPFGHLNRYPPPVILNSKTGTNSGGVGSSHAASSSGTSATVRPRYCSSSASRLAWYSLSHFSLHTGHPREGSVTSRILALKECSLSQIHRASFRPRTFAVRHRDSGFLSWSHQVTAWLSEFIRRLLPGVLAAPAVEVLGLLRHGHPHPMSPGRSAVMRPHFTHWTRWGSAAKTGLVRGERYVYPFFFARALVSSTSWRSPPA